MPTYVPSREDRDLEGWGAAESADDETEAPPVRRRLRPREVSALIEALYWPAKYAVPTLPTASAS